MAKRKTDEGKPVLDKRQREFMTQWLCYWWRVGQTSASYAREAAKYDPTSKSRGDVLYWRHFLATVKFLVSHASRGTFGQPVPVDDKAPL